MNLGRIKTLAIAILLVMNIVFLALFLGRTNAASTYDARLIDSAVVSCRKSGLTVDPQLLKGKIPSYPVFTGDISPLLGKLTGLADANRMAFEEVTGGARLTGEDEAFFFGNDFSFSYTSDEKTELPSVLYSSGFYPLQSHYKISDAMEKTVDAFLEEHHLLSAAERAGYTLSFDACYGSGGDHIVCLSQCIDGMRTSFTLYFLVSGGRVISADGSLCLLSPERRMTADGIGPLQILFAEKNRLDDAAGSGDREEKVLLDLAYGYVAYFDTDGSFYLVPILTLSYEDGSSSHYNYVNGKEYFR